MALLPSYLARQCFCPFNSSHELSWVIFRGNALKEVSGYPGAWGRWLAAVFGPWSLASPSPPSFEPWPDHTISWHRSLAP